MTSGRGRNGHVHDDVGTASDDRTTLDDRVPRGGGGPVAAAAAVVTAMARTATALPKDMAAP
jgi:hypothetical protein